MAELLPGMRGEISTIMGLFTVSIVPVYKAVLNYSCGVQAYHGSAYYHGHRTLEMQEMIKWKQGIIWKMKGEKKTSIIKLKR